MIPAAFIQEWSRKAPWPTSQQVEQDLIICRALCDLFNAPALAGKIAFRGGTAIHKLLFKQPLRYSEDIDLVQKQRREEALAQATGLSVLKAIGDAVPVRLMKRDLLFVVARLTALLDERRIPVLIRQHGMGKPKDGEAPAKLLAAFLPKAEESKLGRILVETAILLSMHNQTDAAKILRDAAQTYKVDVDAISATVKQEFAAKEKGKAAKKAAPKPTAKPQPKVAKKSVAA